jgi:SAM-dependent methyltransferase
MLPLFDHPYNTTALNERAVEVPIAQQWLSDSGRTLEVGNVLGHYGIGPARRIVDRYEVADGVENVDVFDLTGEFDQIVSISTVEHVRWDEPTDREPGESAAAVQHLAGLLAPGGRMLVTAPTGWNAPLDGWLRSGQSGAARLCTVARRDGVWAQTPNPVVLPYGVQDAWAAAVWIGEWRA